MFVLADMVIIHDTGTLVSQSCYRYLDNFHTEVKLTVYYKGHTLLLLDFIIQIL